MLMVAGLVAGCSADDDTGDLGRDLGVGDANNFDLSGVDEGTYKTLTAHLDGGQSQVISQDGHWISSLTHVRTGVYSVNFVQGSFSRSPTCTCSGPSPSIN